MAAEGLQATLRRRADREAIRDLTSAYAHYIWTKDVDAIVDLFTEDAEMDTGDAPVIQGREALSEAYRRLLAGDEFLPFVHNHVIQLQGDAATGNCCLDLRATVRGRSMIGAGQYEDEYVKQAGRWKFRRRRLTMRHFVPLSRGWAEPEGE